MRTDIRELIQRAQGVAQHDMKIQLVARPGERATSFDIFVESNDLAGEMLRYNVAYRQRFFSNWRLCFCSTDEIAGAQPGSPPPVWLRLTADKR